MTKNPMVVRERRESRRQLITVEISPALKAYMRTRVSAGDYESVSDIVREALSAWQARSMIDREVERKRRRPG